MKAVDSHLLTLLKASSQYIVPIYQRLYSWQEPECEQLWSDVLRAGSSKDLGAHFTGSIVYVARGQSTNTSAEPDLIIDGQQRVTTVTLILAALAERLDGLPESEREPIDGFSPRKIRNRYLLNDDEDGERAFKLILSQGDKDALLAILQGTPTVGEAESRVAENYAFFRRKLANPDLDLANVCRGLDKLVVVDVKLERGVDNPQLVFEAMNSTGKKLSQADLIRNYVLMDLRPKDQEKLYTAYWRPMELEFAGTSDWRFDEFVRHYLTIMTGSIPRQDDIYEAFKTHAATFREDGQPVEALVVELWEYARRYAAMALGKEPEAQLRRAFKDLDQIRADVVYPFLLEAYTDYDLGTLDRDELHEIVQMVTSYVFRRAVCRVPTNSLNKTFAGFSAAVRKDRYVDSVKAQFLSLKSYRPSPPTPSSASPRHDRPVQLPPALLPSPAAREPRPQGAGDRGGLHDRAHPASEREPLGGVARRPRRRLAGRAGPVPAHARESHAHRLQLGVLRPPVRHQARHGGWLQGQSAPAQQRSRSARRVGTWPRSRTGPRGSQTRPSQSGRAPSCPTTSRRTSSSARPPHGSPSRTTPNLLPTQRRALFEKFSTEVLALDPGITRQFMKVYVAFRAETSFVEIVPQKARMLLNLNIPIEALNDERSAAWDVSDRGHLGAGATYVALDEGSDFAYVLGLVRQSFEYQMGESEE